MDRWQRFQEWYSDWDSWPFVRLSVVLLLLGLRIVPSCHVTLTPRDLGAILCTVVLVFLLMTIISGAIASLLMVAFLWALTAVAYLAYWLVLCNDWFYDATCWLLEVVFHMRPSRMRSLLSFGGEVLLFCFAFRLMAIFTAR